MSNNANNFNIIITNLKNGVYIKASATVEAALVMPLYIYAVMAVTYMMQIYQIRLEVDAALYNALREQNKYNYLNYVQKEKQNDEIINEKDININDTIVGSLSLHSVLIKNLGSEYAKEHNIKGGNSGIKIICYSYDSSTIQAAAESVIILFTLSDRICESLSRHLIALKVLVVGCDLIDQLAVDDLHDTVGSGLYDLVVTG